MYAGEDRQVLATKVHVASRQPHAVIRLTGLAFAGLVAVAVLLVIAHSAFGLGRPDFSFFIENWVYDFVTVTSGLVILARAALRREERLGWALLGAGLLFWAVGDAYWSIAYVNVAEPPFPSLDDVFYLAGYALVLGGMLAYVRARMGKRSILVWTDVTMGALCVAAIGTSLLLDYVLANTTGSATEIAVAVSYPLFDVATLALAIGAFALTGWRPGRGLGLVILGLVSTATGDAIYTYQSVAGTYTDSAWYLFLWPLGTALIALGALQPTPKRRELPVDEGWRAFASPAVFALAIFALMTLQRQDLNRPIVEVLTAATLIAIVVRITLTFVQNRRLVLELETDSLTGLANRGKLLFDLDRFYSGSDQAPHLLAVLDLDGFKAYNDAFGHPAGDSLLIRLGHQLGSAVGSGGRAYRMGGDEFALIVPGDGDAAVAAVHGAAAALSEHGEGFQVTCSAGWASIPREAPNRGSAVQLADQRMYEHKDSRRPSAGGEVEAVLLRILNQRAPELSEHVNAVKSLALAVGKALELSPGELATLGRASELHDIGKIAIPDAILTKPGPLDEEEWHFMRQHTILGERIVSAAPSLASVGRLIRSSHERWDGKGYPDRIAGDSIPLAARIILVCDAYDAMTSERPYSSARDPEAALAELRDCSGSQFDPELARTLEQVIRSTPADRLPVPVPVA
jgi:two-component system cell cycle response regulator